MYKKHLYEFPVKLLLVFYQFSDFFSGLAKNLTTQPLKNKTITALTTK